MQEKGRGDRNRLPVQKQRNLIGSAVIVFCLVFPVYVPEASSSAEVPARENKQQSATIAARKQTLNTLLSTAGQLRRANDIKKTVQTLNEAGHLQLDLNLPREALITFQQSQALLDQNTDPVTTVDTLNGLAAAHLALNKYSEAQPLLEQARTISEQKNYPAGKAEALLRLSECHNNVNHALAINTAAEALTLWQSIGDSRGIARSRLTLGEYHYAQSSLAEAEQDYQAALDLARQINDTSLQTQSLVYLGFIAYRKGAWQDVFDFLTIAQNLTDAEAEPFRMGQITATFAEAFLETGLLEVGLQKYQQALEYYRQANYPAGIVGMSWGIGRAQYLSGNYSEALTILQQTLADADSHELHSWVAQCHDYLGRTYAALNQPAQALGHFETALGLFIDLNNPIEEARVRALIGQVYQTQGKLNGAGQFYQQALQTFDAIDDHIDRSATLFAMGQLEMKRGNYGAAETYLRYSIQATEDIRSMSSTRDLTAAFSATVHDRYLQYIHCLMLRNDKKATIRAFEISESERARSLAEFLRHTETNLLAGLDPVLAKQEQSLRQLIRAKRDDKVASIVGNFKNKELQTVDVELLKLEDQYKYISATISARYPAYDQITRPRGWDLPRIQEQVVNDGDTILLEYIVGLDKSYVWAITRDSITAHEISGDVGKAAETVYNLLKEPGQSGNQNELAQAAQALSQMILAPVAAQLNKRRIIVIADGPLNYIPFQMLPLSSSNSEPLVAQHDVINAPSASVLGELRGEVASRGARAKVLAAFGNPALGPSQSSEQSASAGTESGEHLRYALRDIELNGDSFDPAAVGKLFYAEREINSLREIATPAATFTGFAANRQQLFSMDFSQYAILHFATHGLLDPKRPEHSGILLSTVDDQGKDVKGFIGLQDIYSLRAPVDLVVLSACRTGLGKEIRGEGLVGLTRGFMYAGATTVVASLWKVDDEATAELMKRFYTEMLQHRKTPDEALRIAQNSIRAIPQWSAPHYWAGFTLQGEYQYVVNSERGWRRYSTLIVIGSLVLFLSFLCFLVAKNYRVRAGSSTVKK